jgi:hypothetical protein
MNILKTSRKCLSWLVGVALLTAPAMTSATLFSISISGLTLTGLGSCGHAPLGCADPVNYPPGGDVNGPYDQVFLVATGALSYDIGLPGSVSVSQTYIFNPGDTGAGSVGYTEYFSLGRDVTVSDGNQTLTQTLNQTGSLLVGMIEDTLTIDPSELLVFSFAGGNLSLRLNGTSITAGIDPEGIIEGEARLIPAPSSLVLMGLGLAGLARRTGRGLGRPQR